MVSRFQLSVLPRRLEKNSYRRVATSQQPVLVTSWTCVWCHECDVLDQDEGSGKERVYSVSQKNPPWGVLTFFVFFHKRLRIFNRYFTHLLYVPIYARLQIFIQLSPMLTKLCHIKRDYPVHIICSKCPPSAVTHALTLLRMSLIALLIVVCGK